VYHKACGSVVTMHKFTQDTHDAFLARYLEMKTEEGKDYGLMKQKLITSFPKNFTTANYITTEKYLHLYLETQRSPYTKIPLSYLLRPHAAVTPASLTAEYDSIDEDLIQMHCMDGDEYLMDTHALFDLWTIIIPADHAITSFHTDTSMKQDGQASRTPLLYTKSAAS
jgi:hypothetical protein